MSFELYVDHYLNGAEAEFPRQHIRDAFGRNLDESERDFWRLVYDAANSCDIYRQADPTNPSLTAGIVIHRPCADLRLWRSLFSLLEAGDFILYFPGCEVSLAARSFSPGHFPPDLLNPTQPRLVTSGDELRCIVENS